ncbi:MAG: IS3 family transposase [Kosmotogaceae bacterium]
MKKTVILSGEFSQYSADSICRALDISRSTYYRWSGGTVSEPKKTSRDLYYSKVVDTIKEILSKKRFSMYGHRRVWNHLKRKYNLRIGKNKVRKLMREHGLSQSHYSRRKGYEKIDKPEVTGPNQYWQIDMTIGYLSDSTPIYTIGIKDVFTREIVALRGYYRARASEWLDGLNEAIMDIFPEGRPLNGLVLGSDNGCQPTSRLFRTTCNNLQITIRYSGYKNPKENGSIERFFRTLKEEHLWLNSYKCLDDYNLGLDNFKAFYNNERMHSSLDYKSPNEFKQEYFTNLKLDKEVKKEYNYSGVN